MPALVPEVQVTKLVTRDVPIRQEWVGTLRGTEDAEIRSQVTENYFDQKYLANLKFQSHQKFPTSD